MHRSDNPGEVTEPRHAHHVKSASTLANIFMCLTNHEVDDGTEEERRNEPHREDVAEDLGEEIGRNPVESVGVLVNEDGALLDEELHSREVSKHLIHDDEEKRPHPGKTQA